mmetsp:Transcript_45633/g.111077  ORF Transcript_45633/g.111077 Transcript_45633/m.111077 type:complete len:362 (+) Transcript_45633:108-1193(+)
MKRVQSSVNFLGPHSPLGNQSPMGPGAASPLGAVARKPSLLEKTVGMSRLKRTQSSVALRDASPPSPLAAVAKQPQGKVQLLVVFDMDNTLVGDLVSLSDRDNIETNVPWQYWPPGKSKGLTPDYILPFLHRGMLRPGVAELVRYLQSIGATIVVYTHSEEKWAVKVCAAIERAVGVKFIKKMFSRSACRDGHPEFTAKKSLKFIHRELQREGLLWVSLHNTIMFDDDGATLNAAEKSRLIKVPSYDYWEKSPWDEVVNDELLAKNPPHLADTVRYSVIEWGIAPPTYRKKGERTKEDVKQDAKWAIQRHKKEQVLASFNKVAHLDRVFFDVVTVLQQNLGDIPGLPEKIRTQLGKSKKRW